MQAARHVWPRLFLCAVLLKNNEGIAVDTIEQLKARLAEMQEEAQAIQAKADAENRDLLDDETNELDGIFAEFEKIEGDIARREKIAIQAKKLEQGQGRKSSPEGANSAAKSNTATDLDGRIETPRISAAERGRWGWRNLGEFAAAVKVATQPGNPQVDNRLYNAPTTTGNESTGADGGFAVPPDFRSNIMTKVQGEDSLLGRTDQMTTSSNSITIPRDETTPWGSTGIQSYWEGENDQLSQSKPALKETQIRLNKLTALVPMTDELLADAPAMTSYLNRKVPEVFDSQLNLAIVQGNGAGRPRGILNGGDLISVAKESGQAADTIVYENIVNMWSRMYAPSRRNAVWLINQDIEPQLFTMSFEGTSSSVPAYMPSGGLSASPYATLMGRPIIPTEACETLGDAGDIILADLSQYLTVMKTGGIRSDVSIHLWFDYDTTAFRFIFRVAGQPHYSSTISKRDGSNTLSHFVTLAARA